MIQWTKEMDNKLKEYRKSHSQKETARLLSKEFSINFTRNGVKNRESRLRNEKQWKTDKMGYKETIEIQSDGFHKSDKLLRMNAEQSKDVNFLLDAHGYDCNEWELVSARNNIWNVYSKEDKIQVLYSSKITVEPKKQKFNIDTLIQSIEQKATPFYVKQEIIPEGENLLEVSLFDAHLGISNYEYYQSTQNKILNKITSKYWKEVLFTIGQDMIHNNDFKGQTANGTQIEVVDMNQAWEDSAKFYEPMIAKALEQSERVYIYYSPGNHDEAISWAFVKYLKARFPQCIFDDRMEQRKIHTFHDIFIGITHGDKEKNKELHDIFVAEFPLEWGKAKVREIHKGHFHVEDSKDIYGTMVRTLATRNKTDKWHKQKGFLGAHKRFMLFEYSTDSLEGIYYV